MALLKEAIVFVALLVASIVPSAPAAASGIRGGNNDMTIWRDAYIYGYPMAENYNTMYMYALNKSSPQYKAPMNTLKNEARVFTHADTAITTPNSDTPYSFAWLDLRAEPLVLTVPAMNGSRYWAFQLVDWYTHNFGYVGTRTTGNDGGQFVIAGKGFSQKPDWATQVFHAETPFVLLLGRTQLFNSSDLETVKGIQAQYQLRSLSQFVGGVPPAPASAIQWPRASGRGGNSGIGMFKIMDFMLVHTPVHPAEAKLRADFMRLGLGIGQFDQATLSTEVRAAAEQGIAKASESYSAHLEQLNAGNLSFGDLFGTREFLSRQSAPIPGYMARFVGARIGLYGNSREEAQYFLYKMLNGQDLNGSKRSYCLTMSPNDMAMAKAFWSLTMYDGKTQLLVQNSIGRYLVNSGMLSNMTRTSTGSVAILISASLPEEAYLSNWLPAPNGTFFLGLRLYMPDQAVISGKWQAPALSIASHGRCIG